MRFVLVIALVFAVAPAALASHTIACGNVVSSSGAYRVTIIKGRVPCPAAKRVVRRWADGASTSGWKCTRKVHFSRVGIYCTHRHVVVWAPSRNSAIIN